MCRFTNRKKANLWGVKRSILKIEGGSEQKKDQIKAIHLINISTLISFLNFIQFIQFIVLFCDIN